MSNEDGQHEKHSESSLGHHRHSIATTISDGTYEWHDAVEDMGSGPEEFVMDTQPYPEHAEKPSPVPMSDSRSSLEQIQTHSNSDIGQERAESPSTRVTVRRTRLPSPVIGDEGSLFAILKKNIGKVWLPRVPSMSLIIHPYAGSLHHYSSCDIQ